MRNWLSDPSARASTKPATFSSPIAGAAEPVWTTSTSMRSAKREIETVSGMIPSDSVNASRSTPAAADCRLERPGSARPAAQATQPTAPVTAAISRPSTSSRISTRLGSTVTGVHNADVAGLAAFRTIILAVDAQADAVLALANAAILLALATLLRMGAKMVNFGGWDMPVEYPATGGLLAEHRAVRSGVGLFDVSHMGDIRVRSGRTAGGARAAVQHISMNDASQLSVGQAQYSAMLYPEGTFVDDMIVHRLGEDDFLIVINAGTREKDVNWVKQNTARFDCIVEDVGDTYTQLAIQGPRAAELLQKLTDVDLAAIKNYWFTHGAVCGLKNVLIARTGYTGEDGFEIYIPSDT